MRRPSWLGFIAVYGIALGCGGKLTDGADGTTGRGDPSSRNAECTAPTVTASELMIVDEAVVNSAGAQNRQSGLWSFRSLIQEMTPQGEDPGVFVARWLEEWTGEAFNPAALDIEAKNRDLRMQADVVCPWLRRTSTNQCTSDCTKCATRTLDLAEAPFRLVAIVNRMDIGKEPWARTAAGEVHFTFALTGGPGDDPAASSKAVTLSIEYALPPTLSVGQWASRWHEAAALTDPDARATKLASVTELFTRRDAAALAQIRTNDRHLGWVGQLREFARGNDGHLHAALLLNTPKLELNNSRALEDFLLANEDAILAGRHTLPADMSAVSASPFMSTWSAPNVEQKTVAAFALGTCNGCHEQNTKAVFHVSPWGTGEERLSAFVTETALPSRIATTQAALCAP